MIEQDKNQELLNWLESQKENMTQLLKTIVNIDSGSRDEEGIKNVANILYNELTEFGIETDFLEVPSWGAIVISRLKGQKKIGQIQLMGHMDTVFPKGTVKKRPFRIENNLAFGPGVVDMKAGLVMNVFILKALAKFGGNIPAVHILFTCDEEIGSPIGRDYIRKYVQGAKAVLNGETGRMNETVIIKRKAAIHIEFEVTGIAAHAGVNPHQGASSILALAHKTIALHKLNGIQPEVTVNVGTVQGGFAPNVICPLVKAKLDVRFTSETNYDALVQQVIEIIEAETIPNTRGKILDLVANVPMSKTPDWLFDLYKESAKKIGFNVTGESTGGAADSGITSSMGIPSLCALGPKGAFAHSEKEYCDLNSLVPRTQALALTILSFD